MKIKATYTPNQFGHYMITPDELEKSYRTLIGRPVKLNGVEVGTVLDAEHYNNNEIELTLELPDLQGQCTVKGIENNKMTDVVFTGLSMTVGDILMSKTERIAILTKYIESKQLKIPDANKLMEEFLFINSQYNCLRPKVNPDEKDG